MRVKIKLSDPAAVVGYDVTLQMIEKKCKLRHAYLQSSLKVFFSDDHCL